MSENEPKIWNDKFHPLCYCGRVLKAHCEAFKYKLFWNCRNEDREEEKQDSK